MTISWFCLWDRPDGHDTQLDGHDRNALIALVKDCPGLEAGFIMTPTAGHDPYFPDSRNPSALLIQLELQDIGALERAISANGHLEPLTDRGVWPSLQGCTLSHQAMSIRRYPVADPVVQTRDGSSVAYMVEYEGPAEDENAWHLAYTARHPLLLAKFPGIRLIEIYTPVSVICGLPITQRAAMQRNKTVFDTSDALNVAMQSSARSELRADALKLPKFTGRKDHFPFHAVRIGRDRRDSRMATTDAT
ncbi:hypothetical protein IB270_31685 [Ensifer sp. ENS05]|uniref:hypothetical protein n=1 Tax=Ensifer sp. ENS05 TaxID=2769277 RepID=UPI00177F89B8|nr:hypothetical protein [Ensifer sp. ENS05]MBD9597395.1 hypothetical protein [Ensifer sp. ENS05]